MFQRTMPKRLLIAEPNSAFASRLVQTAEGAGWSATCHNTFAAARRELTRQTFDALVGNIRLGRFNGIHLAYVAKHQSPSAGVLLYCAAHDPVLARDARSAGAFYEPMETVAKSLQAYLGANLPASDRRRSESADRRQAVDGGRRTTDLAARSLPRDGHIAL
jgi:DNA-binding NtrC family response regulator